MIEEPRDYAAERLAARAEKYRREVARLRQLANTRATDTEPEDPTTAYLDARRGNERTTEDA